MCPVSFLLRRLSNTHESLMSHKACYINLTGVLLIVLHRMFDFIL